MTHVTPLRRNWHPVALFTTRFLETPTLLSMQAGTPTCVLGVFLNLISVRPMIPWRLPQYWRYFGRQIARPLSMLHMSEITQFQDGTVKTSSRSGLRLFLAPSPRQLRRNLHFFFMAFFMTSSGPSGYARTEVRVRRHDENRSRDFPI